MTGAGGGVYHEDYRSRAGCVAMKSLGRLSLIPVALSFLALPLAGCAGCTGDPAQAGFSCGVANAVGGTYERRIAEREATLQSTRSTSRALEAELAASQSDLAALDARERALQRRLYQLDQENRALRSRLGTARQERAASEAELRSLEAQLTQLDRRRAALGSPAGDDAAALAELEALQDQTDELERIIDDLIAGEAQVE